MRIFSKWCLCVRLAQSYNHPVRGMRHLGIITIIKIDDFSPPVEKTLWSLNLKRAREIHECAKLFPSFMSF